MSDLASVESPAKGIAFEEQMEEQFHGYHDNNLRLRHQSRSFNVKKNSRSNFLEHDESEQFQPSLKIKKERTDQKYESRRVERGKGI